MWHGIAGQGSATADRAGDELAGSETASSEDAAGGFEARKGELCVLRVYDPQEAEYPAESPLALRAAVAQPEGDEAAPGPGPRTHGSAAKREGCEADHRGTESRASWLGELFPDGERPPGVPQDGRFCVPAPAPLAVPAGWAADGESEGLDQRSASWDGVASPARHGVLSGASRAQKIIVKPCAGKRHARFERGFHGNRPAAVAGTAP